VTDALHAGTAVSNRPKLKADASDWQVFAASMSYAVDPILEAVIRARGVTTCQILTGCQLVWRTDIARSGEVNEIKIYALVKLSADRMLKMRMTSRDHKSFMDRQALSPTKHAVQRRPAFFVGEGDSATSPTQRAVLMRLHADDVGPRKVTAAAACNTAAEEMVSLHDCHRRDEVVARMLSEVRANGLHGETALHAPALLRLALQPPALPEKTHTITVAPLALSATHSLLPRRRKCAAVRLDPIDSADPTSAATLDPTVEHRRTHPRASALSSRSTASARALALL